MTDPAVQSPSGGSSAWIWLVAIVGGIVLLLAQCDKKSNDNPSIALPANNLPAPPDAAPTPSDPPVTDIAAGDLKLGRVAFGKVTAIDDPASATIYSRNCYAALGETFSWAKLDRCGEFDAIVAEHAMADEYSGSTSDLAYFESEAAAQRYLTAGTGHGGVSSLMDVRWNSVTDFARGYTRKALAAAAVRDAARDAALNAQSADGSEVGAEWEAGSQTSSD
jgi:hypothetical protein